MEITPNKYHGNHLYLKIEEQEVPHLQSTVFEALIEKYRKPLQIMVPSDAERLIGILEQCGFGLKRKCYEIDVCPADLVRPLSNDYSALSEARRGAARYEECAGRMYAWYADTHAPISPLTAARADFDEMLPDTVLYMTKDEQIHSAAFLDGNEIAYVFSDAQDSFFQFADSLLSYMFGKYDRIVFEADDTDRAATGLKEMFLVSPGTSYDTYIKPVKEPGV